MAEKNGKRKRRNFSEERKTLVMHCKLAIGILGSLNGNDGAMTDHSMGQVAAFRGILSLLGEPYSEKEKSE